MKIENIIAYKTEGYIDERPPRVKLCTLVNRPMTITAWEIRKSKFDDGNKLGLFAEITGHCHDDGKEWRTTTSSNVVIDQLKQMDGFFSSRQTEAHAVDCVFKQGKFLKLMPIQGEVKQ